MITDKEFKAFTTFEVLCAAWLESSYYAEESYLKIVSDDLQGKPRAYRKEYIKRAKKGFKDMQIIMKKLSNIIERDNAEFFNESIDKLIEAASKIEFKTK